jgi:CelD/BcsL family acetyltransferase involved in cellulose biosynthesis
LAQLKKKQRHELRRKIRRAEAHEQKISLRIISTREELGKGSDAFLSLMAHDEKKAEFLTPKMRTHLREMITMAFENGWLMLAFLELATLPIAGYLNFDYRNRLWIYNSGIHPDYYDLSPGWVLLGYIIQWAIKNNREGIDFLRGDEAYKYRLGAEDRFIHRLIISR